MINKNKVIPKTKEDCTSVEYDCTKFIDNYRFLSSSLDELFKKLDEDDFKILKKDFPDNWNILNKKLAYPHEIFISIDDYQKTC